MPRTKQQNTATPPKKPTKPPRNGKRKILNPPIPLDQFHALLAHITEGESMRSFCEKHKIHKDAIYRRLQDDPNAAKLYAIAKEQSAHVHADLIAHTAKELLDPANQIDPNKARVAIDALKWTAAKLLPRTYSDSTRIDVTVDKRISVLDYIETHAKQIGHSPSLALEAEEA